MNDVMTRKEFLKRLVAFGIAGASATQLLTACGGSGGGASQADPCNDLTGLSDADKQTRTQFQYTGTSADANKVCDKCALWVGLQGNCGTCQVVKGPINPKGTCTAFAPKPS